MSKTWPEIQQALDKAKRDLKLTGKNVNQRIEQLKGGLDEALWSFTPLIKLELSGLAALTSISSRIGELTQLKELVISENKLLESVPKEIGQLHDLKTLILSDNRLKTIPPEFGLLANLQVLSVSGNQLTALPESLGNLTELLTLNASRNQLTILPDIAPLTRLSTLAVDHNQLAELPPFLGGMPSLQTLSLSGNKLTEVPALLGLCGKLKDLNIADNPFKDKKFLKLVQAGKAKDILNHLKKVAPRPQKEEKETKPLRIALRPPITAIPYRVLISRGQTVRPFITMVIIRDIIFTDETFKAFIDLQTDLHSGVCEKRTKAAIGTHDLDKVKPPFHYEVRAPGQIKFVPLKQSEEFTGEQLYRFYQANKEETMLKYFSIIKKEHQWPVLLDDKGQVLSLAPVINSKYSEMSPQTTQILVECSSAESVAVCKQILNLFLGRFSKIYLQDKPPETQMFVEQVHVCTEEFHVVQRYPVQLDLQDACEAE